VLPEPPKSTFANIFSFSSRQPEKKEEEEEPKKNIRKLERMIKDVYEEQVVTKEGKLETHLNTKI
jgi:hypothetical protein